MVCIDEAKLRMARGQDGLSQWVRENAREFFELAMGRFYQGASTTEEQALAVRMLAAAALLTAQPPGLGIGGLAALLVMRPFEFIAEHIECIAAFAAGEFGESPFLLHKASLLRALALLYHEEEDDAP